MYDGHWWVGNIERNYEEDDVKVTFMHPCEPASLSAGHADKTYAGYIPNTFWLSSKFRIHRSYIHTYIHT